MTLPSLSVVDGVCDNMASGLGYGKASFVNSAADDSHVHASYDVGINSQIGRVFIGLRVDADGAHVWGYGDVNPEDPIYKKTFPSLGRLCDSCSSSLAPLTLIEAVAAHAAS